MRLRMTVRKKRAGSMARKTKRLRVRKLVLRKKRPNRLIASRGGYDQGFDRGYDQGYTDGFSKGFEDGFETTYSQT